MWKLLKFRYNWTNQLEEPSFQLNELDFGKIMVIGIFVVIGEFSLETFLSVVIYQLLSHALIEFRTHGLILKWQKF